jgi:L-threonylcarbamoyladenylate synthase
VTADELDAALTALRAGGVVAAATETWFGFLADARHGAALARILALKGRDANKGIALILPERRAWSALVDGIPPIAEILADRFWPGPLTIALPARATIDARLLVDGSVGARWGAASDASRIAAAFGGALTATSANPSGTPPLATSDDVAAAFSASPDLLVVSGHAPGGPPSTVVSVRDARVRLVREGAVTRAAIATALELTLDF